MFERYESYKDSGLHWLGKVPDEWKVQRLKDMALIQYSNVDKKIYDNQKNIFLCNYVDVYKNEFITHDISFMKATASKEEIRKFLLKKDDVLFTKDSESFDDNVNPCLVSESFTNVVCGYHLAQVRVNRKDIVGAYLFRLLQSVQYNYHFAVNSKGITRVGLGMSSVKDAQIFLPSLDTQIKIATYLDQKTQTIDKEINLLEEKISKYKELKQTLINETVLRGLDKSVKLKDSGIEWIGEIPKGWEVKRLKDIYKITKKVVGKNSKNFKLLSLTQNGVIPRDIDGGIGKFPAEFDTYQIIKNNDLIFCLFDMDVTPRTIGISFINGMITGAYTVITAKEEVLNKYYYYLFLSADMYKKLSPYYSGLRNTIKKEKFLSLNIPKLSYSEQVEIAIYLDKKTTKIEEIVKTLGTKIDTLKEFRKTLINDVVTGKVKVA